MTKEGLTTLLGAVHDGQPGAADELMQLVYNELHQIAQHKMGQMCVGHTLQTTALVHEAFLRLFGSGKPSWENRHHFFWAAARAMRDILVERARRHKTQKRGGDRTRVELTEDLTVTVESEELLALNEAIDRLQKTNAEAAQVVMLRFFGGLDHDQAAAVLGVSSATVRRRWTFARAWLHKDLTHVQDNPGSIT